MKERESYVQKAQQGYNVDFMWNLPFAPGKQETLSRLSLLSYYLLFHYLNVLTSEDNKDTFVTNWLDVIEYELDTRKWKELSLKP